MYCETLLAERQEVRRKIFENATLLKFQPTIPEIWALTQKIKLDKEDLERASDPKHLPMMLWMQRLKFFFDKLIEFNYIRIRTLGYYRTDFGGEDIKEGLGTDFGYKLARVFYHGFDPQNERTKEIGKLFKRWATSGDTEIRDTLFKKAAFRDKHVNITGEQECPTTGERFEWYCNGKTIWPANRILNKEESGKKMEELKARYETLKTKENLTPKEQEWKTWLQEIFEKDFGWMRAYSYTNLEPAKPFKTRYADPKTGVFPKAVVEIDVPSGKLLFANSLFNYLKDFPKDKEFSRENSVNHTSGRNRNIYFHAEENQAFYVPLSNNSPTVWQNRRNPNKLRVGNASEEPRKGDWSRTAANKSWIDRGYICTDLWAFHAVDASRLPKKIEVSHFIVVVTPGRYRLINHFEHKECASGIYCEIERVGDITLPSKKK